MKAFVMIYIFLFIAVSMSGCGDDGSNGRNAESCLVEELEDGVYISCPDSDTFLPRDNSDVPGSDDSEDVVYCKRGKGHKKHKHDKHEDCEEE